MSDGPTDGAHRPPRATRWVAVALAWAAVGLPLLWGVGATLRKTLQLFH